MNCENGEWTFRFPQVEGRNGPFEISPREMTLSMERNAYDYANGEFDTEVGEMMKPHTRNDGGQLRYAQHVQVVQDGDVISTLYFKPDFVEYGDQATYIELHDLQESLDSGIVDIQRYRITLREAYEYMFDKRTNNLINDIKFTDNISKGVLGEERATELLGSSTLPPGELYPENQGSIFYDYAGDFVSTGNRLLHPIKKNEIEADATKRLVDGFYALDFDQISPAKAIWKLNRMFNIQTWVDNNRTLWVGVPEAGAIQHIAAPNDNRVWRYKTEGVNIRHPRDPIYGIVVEGSWIDEPGVGGSEDIISWFDKRDENGFGDVRAEGVAYMPDVDSSRGQMLKVKNTTAKRDSLSAVAQISLIEAMKQQHKGTVPLDPSKSGEFTGPVKSLRVGDALRLIPNDKFFDSVDENTGQLGDEPPDEAVECGSFIHNEVYLVSGVTHKVSGSDWTVNVDVGMFPDFKVDSFVRYFDPRADNPEDAYVTEADVFDGWLTIEDF